MPVSQIADCSAALLANLTAGLTTAGLEVPARRYVSHGDPVHDIAFDGDCDELLAVWVQQVGPTVRPVEVVIAGQAGRSNRAPTTWTARWGIDLIRCVAAGTTGVDSVPSALAISADAARFAADGWVLIRTVESLARAGTLFTAAVDMRGSVVQVGPVEPVGPEGLVAGWHCEVAAQIDGRLG